MLNPRERIGFAELPAKCCIVPDGTTYFLQIPFLPIFCASGTFLHSLWRRGVIYCHICGNDNFKYEPAV
jgi:hypothetical protein